MTEWLDRVRAGDFSAIPVDIAFSSGVGLAHLIDGCAVAGGSAACAEISRRVGDELLRTVKTTASALDLWIALFGEHMRLRHFRYAPSADERKRLDTLVQALRRALLGLSPKGKAGIMAIVEPRQGGTMNVPRARDDDS